MSLFSKKVSYKRFKFTNNYPSTKLLSSLLSDISFKRAKVGEVEFEICGSNRDDEKSFYKNSDFVAFSVRIFYKKLNKEKYDLKYDELIKEHCKEHSKLTDKDKSNIEARAKNEVLKEQYFSKDFVDFVLNIKTKTLIISTNSVHNNDAINFIVNELNIKDFRGISFISDEIIEYVESKTSEYKDSASYLLKYLYLESQKEESNISINKKIKFIDDETSVEAKGNIDDLDLVDKDIISACITIELSEHEVYEFELSSKSVLRISNLETNRSKNHHFETIAGLIHITNKLNDIFQELDKQFLRYLYSISIGEENE